MTAALAGGLLAAFCLVAGWSAWPLRPHGDEGQADNLPGPGPSDGVSVRITADRAGDGPEASQPDTETTAKAPNACMRAGSPSGWLPATRPAPPVHLPPRCPRVCAGRVAIQSAPYRALSVRQQLLAATLASISWPTPEGITA